MPKFSIKSFLFLIAIIAVGTGAIVCPNQTWNNIVTSLIGGLILLMMMVAVGATGKLRV